jgi:hypothetical protein
MGRHAALALVGAVVFAIACLTVVGNGIDARDQFAVADDPVKITDRALDRSFDQTVAAREIQAALDAHDPDLAQSFVDLARDRGIPVAPPLADKVTAATAEAASALNTAGRFARGLLTGEPDDLVGLAGTAVGDLFVFGDIRDATREGTRLVTGQQADPVILGLACVGLAITAGTYATLGAGTPARVGLSLVKVARRTGQLSARLTEWIGRSLRRVIDWNALSRATSISDPALAVRAAREVVKVDEAGELVDLVGNVGRVETAAGTKAAIDSLAIAEGPRDMSRLARLAASKGGKTRAIIKLLGRAAIVLTASAFDLALHAARLCVVLQNHGRAHDAPPYPPPQGASCPRRRIALHRGAFGVITALRPAGVTHSKYSRSRKTFKVIACRISPAMAWRSLLSTKARASPSCSCTALHPSRK